MVDYQTKAGRNMKRAMVFGAGNIGRGLVGRILYEGGYATTFVDVNLNLVESLNQEASYPVYVTIGEKYSKVTIEKVSALDGRDIDAIGDFALDIEVIATAVGVNAIKYIIPSIAKIIKTKYEKKPEGFCNFILCENMIDVHQYVRDLLKEHLTLEENIFCDSHIGFCQSSIGCMVPAPPEHLLKEDPLAIAVEDYNKIYTDKEGIRGEMEEIQNIIAYSPFSYYINRKLFMHNMSHCLCAYHGFKKGYKYISQAIEDEEIRDKVYASLKETGQALFLAYNIDISEIEDHAQDLIKRYGNKLLGDTVERVGQDPKRKLQRNDRLIGAALFCLEQNIRPTNIIETIPLAFSFDMEKDPSSKETSTYYKEEGIEKALEKYCQLNPKDLLFDLIVKADKNIRRG